MPSATSLPIYMTRCRRRVEADVDQVAADLHAQGAAQWADLAADVAAEASDADQGLRVDFIICH